MKKMKDILDIKERELIRLQESDEQNRKAISVSSRTINDKKSISIQPFSQTKFSLTVEYAQSSRSFEIKYNERSTGNTE